MLDFGFSKLAIIGAVALVVVGPEKLPGLARTAGRWWGKAQRALADIKGEINRSIALDELKELQNAVAAEAKEVERGFTAAADAVQQALSGSSPPSSDDELAPTYKHPNKNWRVRRGAMPEWYRQQHQVRRYAQSGAARVARFRPKHYRR